MNSAELHKEILRIEQQRNVNDTDALQAEWRQTMAAWKKALAKEREQLEAQNVALQFRETLAKQGMTITYKGCRSGS